MRKQTKINKGGIRTAKRRSNVCTTLYDLIKLVSEEIRPGEEKLVPVIVNHILETGQSVPRTR